MRHPFRWGMSKKLIRKALAASSNQQLLQLLQSSQFLVFEKV
jgi:hypothetical protein